MKYAIFLLPSLVLSAQSPWREDLEAGRFLKVLAASEARLQAAPQDAPAHAARAQALVALVRLDEAKAEADRALSLDPKHADAYLARGLARAGIALRARGLSTLGGVAEAMDDFRKATELDPALVRAWMSLGLGYQQLPGLFGGSHKKALQCAAALRKVAPAKADLLEATVHSMAGHWNLAEPFFGRALALAPQDPEIIAGYLEALDEKAARKALGDAAKNARLAAEAARLLPQARHSALALAAISTAYLDAGLPEQAWKVAEDALPHTDAPSLLRLQLGKVAARTGIHRQAGLEALDQLLNSPLEGGTGGMAVVHWRRGQVLKDLGRASEAREAARKALSLDPGHRGATRLHKELGSDA